MQEGVSGPYLFRFRHEHGITRLPTDGMESH